MSILVLLMQPVLYLELPEGRTRNKCLEAVARGCLGMPPTIEVIDLCS